MSAEPVRVEQPVKYEGEVPMAVEVTLPTPDTVRLSIVAFERLWGDWADGDTVDVPRAKLLAALGINP